MPYYLWISGTGEHTILEFAKVIFMSPVYN